MRPIPLLLMLAATGCSASAQNFDAHDPRSPLRLVRAIALPDVHGRIDHLSLDPDNGRLFVAELGNGTVDAVDLTLGVVTSRISGLREPQGVAWLHAQRELAVACGDGSVHFYRGADLKEVARISLGDDADNVRVDSRNGNLVVGYGSGALAVIASATHQAIRKLMLPAHPEAFELLGARVFVNVPGAHRIVIGDLDEGRVTSTLNTGPRFGNYPMASNVAASRIAVAYRMPSSLSVMDAATRTVAYSAPICDDADDVFFHARSIIVVCGEGAVQLVEQARPRSSVRVATQRGGRTGLLDAVNNKLFVAVPAGKAPAAIWELSLAS